MTGSGSGSSINCSTSGESGSGDGDGGRTGVVTRLSVDGWIGVEVGECVEDPDSDLTMRSAGGDSKPRCFVKTGLVSERREERRVVFRDAPDAPEMEEFRLVGESVTRPERGLPGEECTLRDADLAGLLSPGGRTVSRAELDVRACPNGGRVIWA